MLLKAHFHPWLHRGWLEWMQDEVLHLLLRSLKDLGLGWSNG